MAEVGISPHPQSTGRI